MVLTAEDRRVVLADLQNVYDEHRYLDAYKLSADYWSPSTNIEDLSAEELIFAGRLASRLGGFRLSRYLYRAARDRDGAVIPKSLFRCNYFCGNYELGITCCAFVVFILCNRISYSSKSQSNAAPRLRTIGCTEVHRCRLQSQ